MRQSTLKPCPGRASQGQARGKLGASKVIFRASHFFRGCKCMCFSTFGLFIFLPNYPYYNIKKGNDLERAPRQGPKHPSRILPGRGFSFSGPRIPSLGLFGECLPATWAGLNQTGPSGKRHSPKQASAPHPPSELRSAPGAKNES